VRRNSPLTRRILSFLLETPATIRSGAAVVWRCPLRTARCLFVLFAGAVVVTACGDSSEPTAVDTLTIEDFVGSWSATSQVFTSNTSTSETFDVISAGGESRFTMLSGGRTRHWFDLGDFHDEWDTLITLNSAAALLTSTPEEASRPVRQYTFTLDGNTLTLTDTSSSFDFTLTGAAGTSATMVAVFQKTG
jgi:hypothetical protein